MPKLCVEALEVAGLAVHGGASAAVISAVLESLQRGERQRLAFCNAHTLALALRKPDFAEAISGLTLLNDGVGLDLAAAFLVGRRFPDNLNGTDFVPRLIAAAPPSRIFLLGGEGDVAAKAAAHLKAICPQHEIAGYRDGFYEPAEAPAIVERITAAGTDILLLGMGHPLQETFVQQNGAALDAKLIVCCGALFDFLAERVPRAPIWVRKLRLEWVFRLALEPRRLLRRYTVEAMGLGLDLVRIKMSMPRQIAQASAKTPSTTKALSGQADLQKLRVGARTARSKIEV